MRAKKFSTLLQDDCYVISRTILSCSCVDIRKSTAIITFIYIFDRLSFWKSQSIMLEHIQGFFTILIIYNNYPIVRVFLDKDRLENIFIPEFFIAILGRDDHTKRLLRNGEAIYLFDTLPLFLLILHNQSLNLYVLMNKFDVLQRTQVRNLCFFIIFPHLQIH